MLYPYRCLHFPRVHPKRIFAKAVSRLLRGGLPSFVSAAQKRYTKYVESKFPMETHQVTITLPLKLEGDPSTQDIANAAAASMRELPPFLEEGWLNSVQPPLKKLTLTPNPNSKWFFSFTKLPLTPINDYKGGETPDCYKGRSPMGF